MHIAEAFIFKRFQLIFSIRQNPAVLIVAVTAHFIANGGGRFQFLPKVQREHIAGLANGFHGKSTRQFFPKIQQPAVFRAGRLYGETQLGHNVRRRLRNQNVVVILLHRGFAPIGIVVIEQLPTVQLAAFINDFVKLCVVGNGAAITVFFGARAKPVLVQKLYAVCKELGDQSLTLVAAVVGTVDKSLIVNMDRQLVVPLSQPGSQIHDIIVVAKCIGICRSLRHELPVDIELVIIIRGNPQQGAFWRIGENDFFAKQRMVVF